jgi:3-keto-5-aminohexanoate cleavage enzyme
MTDLIVEARVNEYRMRDKNPHTPWSPAEIARAGVDAAAAGAAIVHFHGRDPITRAPSSDPKLYAETIELIRSECDVLIHPTLGVDTFDDADERLAHIVQLAKNPDTRPDFAPVDLGSFNLDPYSSQTRSFAVTDRFYKTTVAMMLKLSHSLQALGISPVPVLWNVSSARMLGALMEMEALPEPLYCLAMTSPSLLSLHPSTAAGVSAYAEFMPSERVVHWTIASLVGDAIALAGVAGAVGAGLSLGLGDYHYNQLGKPTNGEVVTTAVAAIRGNGHNLLTANDVRRRVLGVKA